MVLTMIITCSLYKPGHTPACSHFMSTAGESTRQQNLCKLVLPATTLPTLSNPRGSCNVYLACGKIQQVTKHFMITFHTMPGGNTVYSVVSSPQV